MFESFDPLKHVLKMVKGGLGFKDAPRMWRERLHQFLTSFGMKSLQSDRSIYCMWTESNGTFTLSLILSTHVDDLKGGGTEQATRLLFEYLESHVGEWDVTLASI